eukprot:g2930.t1
MFYKAALVSSLAVCLSAVSSAAAQIESDSMDDLGAWGQRYLSSNETELPTTLWRNSNDEFLLSLMRDIDATELGPAERRLLRRIVLSPATPPVGIRAEDLLSERARLMLELGEARATAALVPQLEQAAPGLDAETLAVDLDLASGQEATACETLNGEVREGDYWWKLRAVCAVLRENYSGAQLAIEVASAQGVEDEWLVEAIFAASGDTPNPPGAKFDSGLNIALSSKAVLDTTRVTLAADRPDLAAAAAQRPGVPAELRAQFAEIASAHELISAEDRREILVARFEEEEFEPASAIEDALFALQDPLTPDEDRAGKLAEVLRAAAETSFIEYRTTSELFQPDLESLPQNEATTPFALDFARAALAANNADLALSWLDAASTEEDRAPDPYAVALVQASGIIATENPSPSALRAAEKRLTTSVDSEDREAQAAQVFTAWTGLGLPLSPIARDFVGGVPDRGERVGQGQVTSMKAALFGDAIAEAALMVLVTTNGEAERLAPSDLSELLEILSMLDAKDIARDLALETTEFWSAAE